VRESLHQFLDRVAHRGSWVGGGSVAALTAALAAALLEKLLVRPQTVRTLRRTRGHCLRLVHEDAETFARVIQATRTRHQGTFRAALKASTNVQEHVFAHARTIQRLCRLAKRSVKPRLQSDLHCAMVLAKASEEASRTLIQTNRAWLNDRISAPRRLRPRQASPGLGRGRDVAPREAWYKRNHGLARGAPQVNAPT